MQAISKSEQPTPFAIYGGSFNPPGRHHIEVARLLSNHFSRVIVLPCGFRNDKVRRHNDWIDPELRRTLLELSFRTLIDELAASGRILELDFRDLDNQQFTTTAELFEIYRVQGLPGFVVGADLLVAGATGNAPIQKTWYKGEWIWNNLHWICLKRPGYALDDADLPPHRQLIECSIEGSGSLIRQRIRAGQSINNLVTEPIENLLVSHKAYR